MRVTYTTKSVQCVLLKFTGKNIYTENIENRGFFKMKYVWEREEDEREVESSEIKHADYYNIYYHHNYHY